MDKRDGVAELSRQEPARGRVPPRERKLGDWLYGQIFDRIVRGDYPPRTRLPSEHKLALEFGVSRPVVREALAKLREDEMVVSRRGSGSHVRERPPSAILRFAPLGSLGDIDRCFEFRLAFEARAAALAAVRRGDDDLATLVRVHAGIEDAIVSGRIAVEEDFAFHHAIARASGNHYFAETVALLREHLVFGMHLSRNLTPLAPAERLRLLNDEHEAILAAIRDGDAAAAEAATTRHIENARIRIFEGAEPEGF